MGFKNLLRQFKNLSDSERARERGVSVKTFKRKQKNRGSSVIKHEE